jgi:ADP-ribosyl-[dinitrogen reductase] hydrolase
VGVLGLHAEADFSAGIRIALLPLPASCFARASAFSSRWPSRAAASSSARTRLFAAGSASATPIRGGGGTSYCASEIVIAAATRALVEGRTTTRRSPRSPGSSRCSPAGRLRWHRNRIGTPRYLTGWIRYASNMGTNQEELEALLATGRIRMSDGELLHRDPAPFPCLEFSRVTGMMLGLAIGDALGNTSEGLSRAERRARFGEIRDYPSHPHFHDARGYPSDDSQLAFWTLQRLIVDRAFIPANVLDSFVGRTIFGIGGTVRRALANRRARLDWRECGVWSAGNGALMRIAPIAIPHLHSASHGLWADAALCAMLTHNDSASIASCVAFVHILWELLRMDTAPDASWWLTTFVEAVRQLETTDVYELRSPFLSPSRLRLSDFLARELPAAWEAGLSAAEACDRWYSGAYIPETVLSALYILMKYGHDAEEAIVRAVNDTWDNDTIAAIVGAAVGALHGRTALPTRWREGLSGRTDLEDDNRIMTVLADAERVFGLA